MSNKRIDQVHQDMIYDAWDSGKPIEAKHIKDDRWIDVPPKGSNPDPFGDGPDYLNWEYRLKDKYRVELEVQCGGAETAGVIIEIAAERKHQVEDEGWSSDHDDCHHAGVLAAAGACYAANASMDANPFGLLSECDDPLDSEAVRGPSRIDIIESWPFHLSWFKTTTPRRDLIKAAALIVAEIERIDRAGLAGESTAAVIGSELPISHRPR